jgi:hypothetical protein
MGPRSHPGLHRADRAFGNGLRLLPAHSGRRRGLRLIGQTHLCLSLLGFARLCCWVDFARTPLMHAPPAHGLLWRRTENYTTPTASFYGLVTLAYPVQ